MARMMPAFCPSDCPSPAEPEIFAALRDAAGTEDWIVLHSLDIAQHVRQVAGEADFVVIVPDMGVLCLEVKGARTITRSAEGWRIGRDAPLEARGPFRQAADAMHSLRKILVGKRPALAPILFGSAVVMPYVPAPESRGEWHEWQVIDCQKYNGAHIRDLVVGVLARARAHTISCATGGWFTPSKSLPTLEQVNVIADELRPQFELNESPRARAKREAEEIRKYTEEQFDALDAMTFNPQVLFEGPAGTGKTLLAVEAVRRAAAQDERVLFLCFNRLLAQWLDSECGSLGDAADVSNLHSHMLRVAGSRPPGNADTEYWEERLPDEALVHLFECCEDSKYDVLVVDEAQDILRPRYLDVLDLSLKGGLGDGNWMMFGDLHGQNIYGSTTSLAAIDQDGRLKRVPQYSLRKNCRNTPRVSALVAPFGGITPDYSSVRRVDDGIDPEWRYYADQTSESALLGSSLDGLLREGYRRQEIVVLSPLADTRSTAARLAATRPDLAPYRPALTAKIRYCSIHAFKGLEARAVVVTDMDSLSRPENRTLLYVAITRTTGRLVLIVADTERATVVHTMLASLANGGV